MGKSPVFKSGNPTLLDNYRPSTVIPALSKIIENIIYNQLSLYREANANGLLCPHQFGFRHGDLRSRQLPYCEKILDKTLVKGYVVVLSILTFVKP